MTNLELTTEERTSIETAAEQVLEWLEAIGEAAHARLKDGSGLEAAFDRHARKHLERLRAEQHTKLVHASREPFVARLYVVWDEDEGERPQVLLVTRGAHEFRALDRVVTGASLVSRNGLGRIAEYQAGEFFEVPTPRGVRSGRVVERLVFHPHRQDRWDALQDRIELLKRRFNADSLRALLKELRGEDGTEVEGAADLLEAMLDRPEPVLAAGRGRRVVERMALRDQAILDQYQGDVFRRQLDSRLVLLGPPGTGKTTTLIKRIAQKRLLSELPDEEYALLRDLDVEDLSWRMYSPSELLAKYLREAFGAEGVPASTKEVTTWEQTRTELVRNVFPIAKSATSGRFRPAQRPTLRVASSVVLRTLHDEVAAEVESVVVGRCAKALDDTRALRGSLVERERPVLDRLASRVDLDAVMRFASAEEPVLSKKVQDFDAGIKQLRNTALQHLKRAELESLIERLVAINDQHARSTNEDEDDDEEEDDAVGATDPRKKASALLVRSLNRRAQDLALGRRAGGSAVVRAALEAWGDRLPSDDRLRDLGEALALRRTYETLRAAARGLVREVPRIYAAYRRRLVKEGRIFAPVASGEVDYLKNDQVSTDELDVLLLVSLRNARRILDRKAFGAEDYKTVETFRVAQVYVDEVTDFSPIELACMMELSNHTLRSFFACGDFRQRVTERGIASFDELAWVSKVTGSPADFEKCEIERHYRQSPKLVELARSLAELQGLPEAGTVDRDDDPSAHAGPLLREHANTLDDVASWLSNRILEVEREVGKQVSIAIFVDGEEAAAELAKCTQPLLDEHNLRVQHCREGRDVGHESEVRVFDVQHIKGLEFEAVFLVGVDRLAERLPSLFDRFLYVGVTRAATYLGITCEGALPERLEPVRGHFATGGW
jgi:hypothetical protein